MLMHPSYVGDAQRAACFVCVPHQHDDDDSLFFWCYVRRSTARGDEQCRGGGGCVRVHPFHERKKRTPRRARGARSGAHRRARPKQTIHRRHRRCHQPRRPSCMESRMAARLFCSTYSSSSRCHRAPNANHPPAGPAVSPVSPRVAPAPPPRSHRAAKRKEHRRKRAGNARRACARAWHGQPPRRQKEYQRKRAGSARGARARARARGMGRESRKAVGAVFSEV